MLPKFGIGRIPSRESPTSLVGDAGEYTFAHTPRNSPSTLRINIPESPTKKSTDGPLDSIDQNKVQLSIGASGSSSTGASPLNAGDLGKQLAAAEVGHKISSRALLTVDSSLFLRNVARLANYQDDLSSYKELDCVRESKHCDPLTLDRSPAPFLNIEGNVHDRERRSSDVAQNDHIAMKSVGPRGHLSETSPISPTSMGNGLDDSPDPATVTLEQMLRDASRVHGMRLTWLLYGILFVIVLLFFLLIWQIRLLVGNEFETSLVQLSASSALSQLELMHYGVRNMMDAFGTAGADGIKETALDAHFCTSLAGAPIIFAIYDPKNSSLMWSYACPLAPTSVLPPSVLPADDVGNGTLTTSIYLTNYLIMYGRMNSEEDVSHKSGYFAVIMRKNPIGRILFAGSNPLYSSSMLTSTSTAFLFTQFASSNLAVALHSISTDYPNFSIPQPTPLGTGMYNAFNSVCRAGNAYTWHTVIRPLSTNSTNWEMDAEKAPTNMPKPFVKHGGFWGSISHVSICGVLCFDDNANVCTMDNPTSTWFVVDDYTPPGSSATALTAVAVVSILVVILFIIMVVMAYLSISVPVQHLKFLIFSTVGDKRVKTRREQLLFRLTKYCWLGDLKALVRTFQLLAFCFQLNKKYVPQHILEKQALVLQNDKNYLWHTIVEENIVEEELDDDDDAVVTDHEDMETFVNTVSFERLTNTNKNNVREMLTQTSSNLRQESITAGCALTTETEAGEGSTIFASTHNIDMIGRGMTIVEGATILVVHLCALETAYYTNYGVAVKQHRRIMNMLLGRIRHYRGEPFKRSGECIAAAWNAFESRADHAQRAAACAHSIAKALAPYRQAGFRVGILLHQGPFVCGVFQDNKEAFTTVFGAVPRQAITLGELAASLPWFKVLVTEPAKQSLSSSYESIIVDVIKYHENDTPIALFELIDEPRSHLSSKFLGGGTPLATSAFAVEYARVFFDFRNHEFERALRGIEQLRQHFPRTGFSILRRLELLCNYYSKHPKELPLPYFRPHPTWTIYETIASFDVALEQQCPDCSVDDLLLADMTRHMPPSKSIYEDDMVRFRRELHDNVLASRRTQSVLSNVGTPDAATARSTTVLSATKLTPCSAGAATQSPALLRVPDPFTLPAPTTVITPAEDATKEKGAAAAECFTCVPLTLSVKPRRRYSSSATTAWLDPLNDEDSTDPNDDEDNGAHMKRERGSSKEKRSEEKDDNDAGDDDVDADELVGTAGRREGGGNRRANGRESVLSLHTPTELPSDGEMREEGGRQRFSFTNRLAATVMEQANRSLRGVTDSFVSVNSETLVNAQHMSFRDLEGSLARVPCELPTEIMAKNGIKYLRSSRILGKGSFGCVYLGMDVLSGRMVAIKFLPLPSEEEEICNVETEVVTMQQVKSGHVVEFISYAFQNNLIIILMECMMAGSLQSLLSAFTSIPAATARLFIRDMLRGLHKLHSMGVIHRDVKPQNVLLTLAGNCKISDFGASAFLQELVRKQLEGNGMQVQGTPVYLAPEAARGTPEEKSDIWSCGIVFIQLVTGELPYPKEYLRMQPQILVFQIGSGAVQPIIPDGLDEFEEQFVRHCLQIDPNERLAAKLLLELPMFAL